MIGGLVTSFLMELLVYPVIYALWRERDLPSLEAASDEHPKHHWWQRPAVVSGLVGLIVALAIAGYMSFPRSEAKPLFARYESVRQSLLTGSLDNTRANAAALAGDARASKHPEIAAGADALAKIADIEKARDAFATLSDSMIAYRASANEGPKPQVVYCSMARRSWLQPAGAITNPYYADPAMRSCGEIKSE